MLAMAAGARAMMLPPGARLPILLAPSLSWPALASSSLLMPVGVTTSPSPLPCSSNWRSAHSRCPTSSGQPW
jgi:hypothetical protein